MPENLQVSERAVNMQDCIEQLEEIQSNVEDDACELGELYI